MFNRDAFALAFHQEPPVSLAYHIEIFFNEKKLVYVSAGVTFNIYLDGAYHPLKQLTTLSRKHAIEESTSQFRSILTKGDKERIPEIIKLMKASCFVVRVVILYNLLGWCRKNDIRVIGCPFETDHQAVADEIVGKTDASVTVDSDFFVAGSRIMVDNLQSNARRNILYRDKLLNKLDQGAGFWDIPAFASFLGNDFIQRPHGWPDAECGNNKSDAQMDRSGSR